LAKSIFTGAVAICPCFHQEQLSNIAATAFFLAVVLRAKENRRFLSLWYNAMHGSLSSIFTKSLLRKCNACFLDAPKGSSTGVE
jgi:hypothetical protein